MDKKKAILALALAAAVLMACGLLLAIVAMIGLGPGLPEFLSRAPETTPLPVKTVRPTFTPLPTATPTVPPTATPVPTDTPLPTATPLPPTETPPPPTETPVEPTATTDPVRIYERANFHAITTWAP